MRYLFLPPYSPDFNPIESAFSAIKYHIRRHGDIAREAMVQDGVQYDNIETIMFLINSVFSVTAQDASGWFHSCGYF
ncbi:hypothetical protein BDV93DRAFT_458883 [Ceratobasidium sp. AG-I]|nr:hypothetical protein BDV93DRAFT_461954 [Ceratobasidium sp. AG-I]KAF8593229.1 hypothetical protein BDV93DRAFT_461604 [Ceratobasidium sp. AG-I]KAF8594499.1 hypothetical protein BDV93DRAFT_458883 [Ceratobasidium sp. AG-I]